MRKRRSLRKVLGLVSLAGVVITLAGMLLTYLLRPQNPYAKIDIPARIEQLVRQNNGLDREGAVNGWPSFIEAIDRFEQLQHESVRARTDQGRVLDFYQATEVRMGVASLEEADPDDLPYLLAALDIMDSPKLIEIENLLEQAIGADGFAATTQYPGSNEEHSAPWLGASRQFARMQRGRWQIALAEGNEADAVGRLQSILAVARAVSGQISVIDQLVSSANDHVALSEIQKYAIEGKGSDTIRRLAKLLESKPRNVNLIHVLQCDKYLLMGSLLEMGKEYGWKGVKPVVTRIEMLNDAHETTVELIQDPSLIESEMLIAEWLAQHEGAYAQAAADTMQAWMRFVSVEKHAITYRDVVRLLLAIRLYEIKNGTLPQTLEDLVPDLINAIPPDQYSPDGFVYRPIPDSHTNAPFTLYSIGPDGIDNDGRPHPDGNHATVRAPEVGYDINFTLID